MNKVNRQINPAAVALRYKKNQTSAPQVIAKGSHGIAEKILNIANQYNIPIIKNSDLLNLLMAVEIDQPIPKETFEAVAAIYAFLLELDENYEKILA
jgi:flagellar biosynthetic protein FlhB/flagellar biosynthesis protein